MIATKPIAALILDRDDTLVVDTGYMSGDEPIIFVNGVVDLCVAASRRGVPIYIVTNQSGIGRGFYSEEEMQFFNERLYKQLLPYKIVIAGLEFCPHTPEDSCLCRKPNPGMLYRLSNKYGVDLTASIYVGDKASDKELGDSYCKQGVRIDSRGFSPDLISEIMACFN
jgi:D-glycero-D-manno-heptose 1,7-bisphosphate phosphatase